MTLKDLVKSGNMVTFDSYRQGHFYYNVATQEEPMIKISESHQIGIMTRYQFPVPLEDVGTATLLHEDKAITFMRWIRKAMADGTLIKLKDVQ
jgi:hypothetical protein